MGASDEAMKDLSVVGSKSAIQVDQALDDVARQILGADSATRSDGRAHLFEVRRAGVTLRQVLLETAALSTREAAVEIVAHQFDGVATHER